MRAPRARRRALCLLLSALGIGPAVAPAGAVLLGAGDGAANTAAPPGLPAWRHLGQSRGLSAVYLGGGWVLTAAHVGPGEVSLAGARHPAVPGSVVRLENPGGGPLAPDLVLFRIEPGPELPALELGCTAPGVEDPVWLAGYGRDRGERLLWRGLPGWRWAATHSLRWGTNRIFEVGIDFEAHGARTRSFSLRFDEHGTRHEAQAAHGDSGGAVFRLRHGRWELAGLLHAIAQFEGQPAESAVFGNLSYAADLSFYCDQIDRVLGSGPAKE